MLLGMVCPCWVGLSRLDPDLHMGEDIIVRISNRVFVGLQLCMSRLNVFNEPRDREYLDTPVQNAVVVVLAAKLLHFLPQFLKP